MILKNPENGLYFKLSDQGQFIWQQLNGKQTMQDITLLLADKFHVFAPDVVTALISKLAKSHFVENIEVIDDAFLSKQPFWVRAVTRVRRFLEVRVVIGDADKLVTKLYNGGGKFLFTAIGQIILAALAIAGVVAFSFATPGVYHAFKTIHDSWMLLIMLLPITLFTYTIHEFGHALATKAFGYEVHYMGVGWYWFMPAAFTDTSDMWLSTRWPRTAVNLAGVYADILNAGIVSFLIYLIPNLYVQAFLWLFCLFTYINAFRMLSPLQELDGYYVLMDVLDRPRLRQSAVLWLVKEFPKAIRQPSLFKQNLPEVCYWLACIVFLILVTLLTVVLQTMVFNIIGIHSSNQFVSIALPFFIILISSISIIADVRSQA
jgi:putative peptide zinc metalloprotease protein